MIKSCAESASKSPFPADTNGGHVWMTPHSIEIDFLKSATPMSFACLDFPWKPHLLRSWEDRSLWREVIKIGGKTVLDVSYDPETGETLVRKQVANRFVDSYLEARHPAVHGTKWIDREYQNVWVESKIR